MKGIQAKLVYSNMKTALSILVTLIVIGGAFFLYERHDADNGNIMATSTQVVLTGSSTPATNTSTTGVHATPIVGGTETVDIRIAQPLINQVVSSPLTISGQAKGTWFFEATAPVSLMDASGKKIAEGHITATGDWMTTNFVPFTGTLSWATSTSATTTAGTLVFMNDNPSGDPALQKTVTVPVRIAR